MSPSRGRSFSGIASLPCILWMLLLCLNLLPVRGQQESHHSPGDPKSGQGTDHFPDNLQRREAYIGDQDALSRSVSSQTLFPIQKTGIASVVVPSPESKGAQQASLASPPRTETPSPPASTLKHPKNPNAKPTPNVKKSQNLEKKDPFNYASFDCGALILASNPEAKEVSAILVNSKDRYMLNRCGTRQKWFEIEFCEEILVESISLANYELFSSTFREFKVFVNNRYPASPTHPWQLLGTFTSKNVRGKQVFTIESPVLWAKYLRLEFVTHYGNEFYCPFSQIKVFGTTMMEEVKAEEQQIAPKKEIKVPIPPRVWLPTLDSPKLVSQPALNLDILKKEEQTQEDEDRALCPNIASESIAFLGDAAGRCLIFTASQSGSHGKKYAPPRLQPGKVQESIFKNIIKRLALLEESAIYTQTFLKEQEKALRIFMDNTRQEQEEILLRFMEEQWSGEIISTLRQRLEYTVRHIEHQQSVIDERLEKLDAMTSRIQEENFANNMLWQIPFALTLFIAKYIYNQLSQSQEEPRGRRKASMSRKSLNLETPMPVPIRTQEKRMSVKDLSFLGRADSPIYLRKKRKRKTVFARDNFPPRLSSFQAPNQEPENDAFSTML